MNSQLTTLRNTLEQRKGKRSSLEETITTLKTEIREKTRELHRHEEAREVVRTVGLKTQEQLSFHISDITSLAMEAIFADPYQLKVDFVQRRNKTECDLLFTRDNKTYDPLSASGVGAVDVAAFALRIASWSMQVPHSRNTIILDEPFKCLDNNRLKQVPAMIQEISRRLGIQFIIITHEPILTSIADRVFESSITNGVTKIIQQ